MFSQRGNKNKAVH